MENQQNQEKKYVKKDNPFFRKIIDRYDDAVKLLVVVIIYILFSVLVHYLKISAAEINLFKFINKLPSGMAVFVKYFMYLGTYQGAILFMIVALLIKKRHLFYLLLTGSALTWSISYVVKLVVDRVRPIAIVHDIITREVNIASYGFPSGHTAMATALTVIIWPYVKIQYRKFLILFPVVMALARMYVGVHLPLDVVGGLFLGLIIGYFTRLLLGEPQQHLPSLEIIREELKKRGLQPVRFQALTTDAYGSIPFIVTLEGGHKLFCKISTPKHFSKDWIDKLYRMIFYRREEQQQPFVTNQQRVEHEAYFQQSAHRAGVRVPEMLFTSVLTDRNMMSVARFTDGVGLDHFACGEVTDEIVQDLWRQVKLMHQNQIAHRDLRLSNIIVDQTGKVWLIDFGSAESTVNANFMQKDMVDLMVSLSIKCNVKKIIELAKSELGEERLIAAYPFIQPAEVDFSIRWEARRRNKDIFAELRREVESTTGLMPEPLASLQRFTVKKVALWIVIFIGLHYLILQFTEFKEAVLRIGRADFTILLLVIGLRLVRFMTDALAFVSVARRKLSFWTNYLVQLAGTFLNRVSLAGLGSVYVEQSYLAKSGLRRHAAFSVIGMNYASGLVAQVPLVALFLIFGGRDLPLHLKFPHYLLYIPIVVGAAVFLLFIFFLISRNLFFMIFRPLRDGTQHLRILFKESKTVGIRHFVAAVTANGISLLFDITTLFLVVIAFHGHLHFTHAGLIVLGSGLLAAPSPTPGKIGAYEAILIVTLKAFGFDTTDAITIGLVYRLLTFWFPLLPGSIAYQILRRQSAI